MPSAQEFVDRMVASDTVVMFTKSYCPYCIMAEKVFDQLKKKYTAIDLAERDDADEIMDVLAAMTGARSVPRVFIKGQFIGGGTDVKKLFEDGELEKKF